VDEGFPSQALCEVKTHVNCPYCYPILTKIRIYQQEQGSSVSIVSDYGLDDRVIEVRSPAASEDFSSSLCVQTGSEAHPASCTMDTGGPFPGRSVTLTTHLYLVPRSIMSRSYISSPLKRIHGV
jgi:hypothetical protein